MRRGLERIWYERDTPPWWLLPAASLFGTLASARRRLLQPRSVGVPVIVVGNITVGGAGKTPVVGHLVALLQEMGRRPGIVARGYGGRARRWPQPVTAESDPRLVGDEPVLHARRSGCPVAVGPDRVAAARLLADSGEVDVIVSDDGLQHYRLARICEIAVVDGRRGLGNGALLPAGPLREPASRLCECDLVLVNGGDWQPQVPALRFSLRCEQARPLAGGEPVPLAAMAGRRVHAVAGIGDPQRFFDSLRAADLDPVPHPFPDHHAFRPEDLRFDDGLPVLMTEKDAVKCAAFARAGWYAVPASVQMEATDLALVRQCLASRLGGEPSAAPVPNEQASGP